MNGSESTQGWMHISGGVRLFGRRWPVASPKATVVIIHGYADHIGRYNHVGRFLKGAGLNVFAADLRGHGQSDGDRGYVSNFDEYLDDVEATINVVRQESSAAPIFLLGHSMGGLVSLCYAIQRQPEIAGMVISSPFLGVAIKVSPLKIMLGKMMSKLHPKLALSSGINPADLSHDPAVGEAYSADPLVFKTVTARWYTEAMRAIGFVSANAADFTYPILILQAAEDRLADPKASRPLFDRLASQDKTYIEYPGFYHEIFNEIEKEKPLEETKNWFLNRT
ncbi:lysophospholipase [Candidatus Sumerlaeota bacterium]|nr:lysophospholipase [Candidatus Sumerlaeota bacterium]